ncbi:MAG: S8 family serine peptidase, partial [Actinomycetota bacterium]
MTRALRHLTPRRLPVLLAVLLMALGPAAAAAASPDPILPQQWALAKIHAQEAWATSTGSGVVVAVVDSGVNFDHEDLRGQSAGSFSCIGTCTPGGGDVNGHGTAVASVVAAAGNNGVGISGVAPSAKVLSVRVLDADGTGTISDVAGGIVFAAEQGAKVINISIGTSIDLPIVFGLLAPELQTAIGAAWAKGAVVVAAAGNGGLASSFTSIPNLLVVGATGPSDEIAAYSSSLTGVELHAPGGNHAGDRCSATACITVAEAPNIYRATEGTSFAAPHVSGVAALLGALGLSNADIVARLKSTADPIPRGTRLNAAKAVGPPRQASPPEPAAPPSVLAAPPVARVQPATPAQKPSPSPVP